MNDNIRDKGFTLVELIIVIAIIAILAIILAPNLVKWIDRSRWSTDQANANILLKEVQDTVVFLGTEDKDPGAGSITITSTSLSTTGGSDDFWNEMDNTNMSKWRDTRVTNHGQAKGAKSVYQITFSSKKVEGKWIS